MERSPDFIGWATVHNVKCTDGRTIMKDAFAHNDGRKVPLVWNHGHDKPENTLGHVILKHRDEGMEAYGYFNNTPKGRDAKEAVRHGDITALSIYANHLKQHGPISDRYVEHGEIREVSLVYASANPMAFIESVMVHADGADPVETDEAYIFTGKEISICHSDEDPEEQPEENTEEVIAHAEEKPESKKEDNNMATETKTPETNGEKTVKDVFDSMTEEQQNVVYAMIGMALEEAGENDEGDENMKHNVFDSEEMYEQDSFLSHADQENIISLAKSTGVGSFRDAYNMYLEDSDSLAHGFDTAALEALLPDYKNITPGAPDIIRADQTWVMPVINKIHKSPYARIRTRHADARIAELKAKGYQNKGDQKKIQGTIKLINRTFDPQTVYVKDEMHRDDIIDITDFDQVAYVWNLMKDNMYETLALAVLIGDGRDDSDPDKIHENHICSIWNDDELYTIHRDVDVAAAKAEIQGTNTSANFSENYIYAEAIIRDALYAREKFKGSGSPDFYCAPHLVNVMLLARDLNGRRIYDSKADLARALNVNSIVEIEQFDGKIRTLEDGTKKKLLGLFVNLVDYQFGSTKGGEVTKFEDFDIDFNKHKYLMETRLSGGLTKLYSAIALEEPYVEAEG